MGVPIDKMGVWHIDKVGWHINKVGVALDKVVGGT